MWGGGVITNPVPGSTGSFFKKYLHGLISWVPMKNPIHPSSRQCTGADNSIQYYTQTHNYITNTVHNSHNNTFPIVYYTVLYCTTKYMYSTPPGVFSLGSCEEAKARTQHILFPTKITGFVASSVLPPLRIITRFSQHPPPSFLLGSSSEQIASILGWVILKLEQHVCVDIRGDLQLG